MKLVTKAIENEFNKHPLYSQDGKGENAKVLVKFFNPYGAATWYVLEASEEENGDRTLYGLVTLFGDKPEYGYFMLSDILNTKVNVFGHAMPLERDQYFKGTVADVMKNYR